MFSCLPQITYKILSEDFLKFCLITDLMLESNDLDLKLLSLCGWWWVCKPTLVFVFCTSFKLNKNQNFWMNAHTLYFAPIFAIVCFTTFALKFKKQKDTICRILRL